MALYVVRQLTATQLALGKAVCAKSPTLHDRVRELRDLGWRGADPADVNAVRVWLFDVHRDDELTNVRDQWASLVARVE